MNRALVGLFAASLGRRRVATALGLFAIALGVALGLAVQLIHGAALDEFGRGMRELAGEADLQVSAGREGFDEQIYLILAQRPEVAEASPVLEIEARLPLKATSLRVIGVDLFRIARVQPALIPLAAEGGDRFAALQPDTLFLSAAAREKILTNGELELITVQAGTRVFALRIAGTVPGAGVGQALGIMDIGAAQEAFDRIGRLSRIDLKLVRGVSRAEATASLSPLLPAGVSLAAPEVSAAEAAALSRAYRVNLTMLAAIALLTGGFLVFSTQWLSVVRRRREFALLRALGMGRRTLLQGLLIEGALTGLAGGVAGVALGHLFAALAFQLIGGDLGAGYFDGIRPSLQFSPVVSAVYLALGIASGIAGAWLPAREASRTAPASALKAGAGDGAALSAGQPRGRLALAALTIAAFACLLPPIGGMPLGGYLAVALILACAVLGLPGATRTAMRLLAVGTGAVWRLAHARLSAAPGQAVVAGAGVVASVALAVSMAIMVSSFRVSVDDWLTTVLPADLYVRTSSASESGFFEADAVKRIEQLAGIASMDTVRAVNLRLIDGRPPVTLLARSVDRGWGLPLVSGTLAPSATAGDPAPPAVWVSEVVADFMRLQPGSALDLPLAGRVVSFRVAGIWRDYARQNGAVVVDREVYRQLTGDTRVNDVALRLRAGHTPTAVAEALRAAFGDQLIEIALPGEIRAISLQIFDRTFVVTYLMEAVAIVIGLFGIATTFAALATARRGEFGMLRHLGLTRGEIGRLIAIEGALTAAVGVSVGVLAGGGIAWVLIEVINRQSFHWSMDLNVPIGGLALFCTGMILLAALVARLAGARAMRQSAVLAVREDW
ncbi:MAG: FtsX-like permease family protein [Azoarcus sp.]|nr:FtsX-like permease family protein [Azoarcus sp.]